MQEDEQPTSFERRLGELTRILEFLTMKLQGVTDALVLAKVRGLYGRIQVTSSSGVMTSEDGDKAIAGLRSEAEEIFGPMPDQETSSEE